MYLYNLTLSRPGAVQQVVGGSFSAPKQQELVVARGDVLELLRPDESGKVETVHRRVHAGKLAPRRAGAASRWSPPQPAPPRVLLAAPERPPSLTRFAVHTCSAAFVRSLPSA